MSTQAVCRVGSASKQAGGVGPFVLAAVWVVLGVSGIAWAVQPKVWSHDTEADFEPGDSQRTLITNFGDIRLTARAEIEARTSEQANVIYDLHRLGKMLYVAGGPEAKLLRRPLSPEEAAKLDQAEIPAEDGPEDPSARTQPDAAQTMPGNAAGDSPATEDAASDDAAEGGPVGLETVLELPGRQVFALDQWDGQLLVAVSGEPCSLALLVDGELQTLHEFGASVRYVWDLVVDGSMIYAATGTEGRLLRVDLSDPQSPVERELLDAEQANLLCLGQDGQGRIYAGSDTDGLVFRLRENLGAGPDEPAAEVFVLYDAPEPEIGALVVQDDGTVYVGTADADQARPGRLEKAASEAQGRPQEADPATLPPEVPGEEAPEDEPDVPNVPPPPEEMSEAATDGEAAGPVNGEASSEPAAEGGSGEAASGEAASPESEGDAGNGAGDTDADEGDDAPSGRLQFEDDEGSDDSGNAEGDEAEAEGEAGENNGAEQSQWWSQWPLRGSNARWPHGLGGHAEEATATVAKAPDTEPLQEGQPEPAQAEAEVSPQEAPEPTPQQRDALRNVIRQRLLEARQRGVMPTQAGPVPQQPRRMQASGSPPQARRQQAPQQRKQGNAIYRIDPNGYVAEVFRESVMILRMVHTRGRLLVATGNEGQLFSVDPAVEETSVLLDLEPQQIPAVLVLDEPYEAQANAEQEGEAQGVDAPPLMLGTANPGRLIRLDRGYSDDGVYTGPVLDAAQVSLYGKLHLVARIPEGSRVEVQTRTGNVQDPARAAWSAWSEPVSFGPRSDMSHLHPRPMDITSPPARFLQYRLRLFSDGQVSPVVDQVEATYVMPNLRPRITAVAIQLPNQNKQKQANRGNQPAAPEPPRQAQIKWKAEDPNEDQLVFDLEYQLHGKQTWLPLASDLDKPQHVWAINALPDGYYRVRVIASDAPDNVPGMALENRRISEPLLVDNTKPTLTRVQATPQADGSVRLEGTAEDRLSRLAAVHYAVDSGSDYQPVLPTDLIYDSTRENFTATIADLAPGPHLIQVRVTDAAGNAQYTALEVEIPEAK